MEATVAAMAEEQDAVTDSLDRLREEKAAVEDESKCLFADIKTKDEIIKSLTKENLAINSKLTQL